MGLWFARRERRCKVCHVCVDFKGMLDSGEWICMCDVDVTPPNG